MPAPAFLNTSGSDPSKRQITPLQIANKRKLAIRQLGNVRQSITRGDRSCINTNLIALQDGDTRQIYCEAVTPRCISQRLAHVGIEGAVTRKDTATPAAMHNNQQ